MNEEDDDVRMWRVLEEERREIEEMPDWDIRPILTIAAIGIAVIVGVVVLLIEIF